MLQPPPLPRDDNRNCHLSGWNRTEKHVKCFHLWNFNGTPRAVRIHPQTLLLKRIMEITQILYAQWVERLSKLGCAIGCEWLWARKYNTIFFPIEWMLAAFERSSTVTWWCVVIQPSWICVILRIIIIILANALPNSSTRRPTDRWSVHILGARHPLVNQIDLLHFHFCAVVGQKVFPLFSHFFLFFHSVHSFSIPTVRHTAVSHLILTGVMQLSAGAHFVQMSFKSF